MAPAAPPLAEPAPAALLSAPPVSYDAPSREGSEQQQPQRPRQFGAMLDVGLPDGIMASFVYRPLQLARLHAGLGYNGVSPGLRLGAAFLPFGAGPSVDLDYGHYFEGDANGLVGAFAGTNEGDSVLLESVGYDFVSLRAGMEFGGDRFTFLVRGGVSWLRTTIHHFDSLLDPGNTANGNTSITIKEDPVLSLFAPSLQLGFIVQL